MIETKYSYTKSSSKTIEKIIDNNTVAVNHMVLAKGDCLPEHHSNSNVYMIVISGTVSLRLENQEEQLYESGSIVNIPFNVKMNVSNQQDELLEFFVVKAPGPKTMKK